MVGTAGKIREENRIKKENQLFERVLPYKRRVESRHGFLDSALEGASMRTGVSST